MDQNKYDLAIDSITNGGEGIGRLPDGRAAFVPFTIPGETVRIEVEEEKRGFVRGKLLDVLDPSPKRIKPRCQHFGICGGCQFQHLEYTDQVHIKTEILKDVLSRVGGLSEVNIKPMISNPHPWEYRNNVQHHLHPSGKLGYLRQSSNEVIPIEECLLPNPLLGELRTVLDMEIESGVDRVTLREGMNADIMVILESGDYELPEMEIDLPASVVHLSKAGKIVLAGSDHLWMMIKDRQFKVSAESFFQVNLTVAEAMVDHVISSLPDGETNCIIDLFCGVGLFSAFAAPKTKHLIGVESSPSAVMDFVCNLDEFDNVEIYEGLTDTILPGLKKHADVVIADPPRAGISRTSLDALLLMKPSRIIYVSCDQATLARDAARLVKGGYTFAHITPFDMFPQTQHIESISLFMTP